MHHIIFILLITLTPCLAVEHPKWSQLRELFGLKDTSQKVQAFVKANNLSESTKGSSGSFTSPDQAYTLMYSRGVIDTIILMVGPRLKKGEMADWLSYGEELPAKIKRDHRIGDLTKLFGKSHTVQGHSWIHEGLDIWVHFSKEGGAISSLYISRAEGAKPK